MTIELWFDFSCPYAYLASQRAAVLGVPIDWRPMLLGGVFRGIGAGAGPMATISAAKAAHNLADMHRWAARFDVPFRMPAAHPMRTVRALRVLLALPHATWPRAIEAIYAAYWQRGEDITSDAVIAGALAGAAIDPEAITLALSHGEQHRDELHARTQQAIELGIFGAPAFVIRRDDPGGPGGADDDRPILVWGQDRSAWLEAVLAGWDPDASPPPGGSRAFAPRERASPGTTLDFYFDVASPFAYFALTQLTGLAATGAEIRLVPILLGGLFRDIGQADVPLATFPPPKLAYVTREMQRWAHWWNVPFDPPAKFPQRTIKAQRLAVLAADEGRGGTLATALGRAMWAEQRDLEDDATLRELVTGAGLPASWVERTADPELKARLIANTTAARAAGVFGVPTFIVTHPGKDPQLLWGQDRLELVATEVAS
ncbi:MAG: DsbA family protein [Kofleriaceae bacterium]